MCNGLGVGLGMWGAGLCCVGSDQDGLCLLKVGLVQGSESKRGWGLIKYIVFLYLRGMYIQMNCVQFECIAVWWAQMEQESLFLDPWPKRSHCDAVPLRDFCYRGI